MQEDKKRDPLERLANLKQKVISLENEKKAIFEKPYKGVYIFASFDLVNSTKIKYRDSNWLRLINELIDRSSAEWFGLKFWKFNGDELLYYAEVTAINQLAKILHQIYEASINLQDKLLKVLSNDETLGFASDLVGIKTAVWIAYVSDDKDAINTKLNLDYIDFAGINMDEGFRMSKCAIQNKIVVDPKIAFLICLVANEIYSNNIKIPNTLPELLKHNLKNVESLKTIDDIFSKFWIDIAMSLDDDTIKPSDEVFDHEKDLFKVVANNFRIIGYEKCKGVWEERPYPIIWYSDNWDKTIDAVKYDELYIDTIVTKSLINTYYHEYEQAYLDTLKILRKIYDNVRVFSYVINKILLECDFKLYAKDVMDKQIYTLTYLYYSIVCINKKTGGVLAFLRSPKRGHMPDVWDFEQQKNAYTIDSQSAITQIEDRFKKNFGLNIKVVSDQYRSSVVPMGIHPIYRRGKIHTGIVCFAYIDDDSYQNEDDIIHIIETNLPNVKSSYDYPLYSKARFIHKNDITLCSDYEKSHVLVDGTEVSELAYDEIYADSNTWNNHNKIDQGELDAQKCTRNFIITIKDAIEYTEKQEFSEEK